MEFIEQHFILQFKLNIHELVSKLLTFNVNICLVFYDVGKFYVFNAQCTVCERVQYYALWNGFYSLF